MICGNKIIEDFMLQMRLWQRRVPRNSSLFYHAHRTQSRKWRSLLHFFIIRSASAESEWDYPRRESDYSGELWGTVSNQTSRLLISTTRASEHGSILQPCLQFAANIAAILLPIRAPDLDLQDHKDHLGISTVWEREENRHYKETSWKMWHSPCVSAGRTKQRNLKLKKQNHVSTILGIWRYFQCYWLGPSCGTSK